MALVILAERLAKLGQEAVTMQVFPSISAM
jgi:hypothetical protein